MKKIYLRFKTNRFKRLLKSLNFVEYKDNDYDLYSYKNKFKDNITIGEYSVINYQGPTYNRWIFSVNKYIISISINSDRNDYFGDENYDLKSLTFKDINNIFTNMVNKLKISSLRKLKMNKIL